MRLAVCRHPSAAGSGYDIRRKLIFDLDNAVAQLELALLQSLHLQQVGTGCVVQRLDGGVEIAMLLPQTRQLGLQLAFVFVLHRRRCTDGLKAALFRI